MRPGDIIFLSASVPVREGWTEDSRPNEIEDAIISIARAVFARKGRLLFGGHPSVSPLVASVASEYFPPDPARSVRPVVTFQSRLFENVLPDETTEMVRMGWSAIEWTPIVKGDRDEDTRENSLATMRGRMLARFEDPDDAIKRQQLRPPLAMVGVGGMQGIRDEALAFLQSRESWGGRPCVYLFRSGGGAAARLLDPSPQRLWPGSKPDLRAFDAIRTALAERDLVDVEAAWHQHHRFEMPSGTPFQPYAAITQWLLDTQLH
jgi:hypothetical protein